MSTIYINETIKHDLTDSLDPALKLNLYHDSNTFLQLSLI